LVRLAGIEPTTPWFVAKYSIQLSYSRQAFYFMLKTIDSFSLSKSF
jgi:transcription elongation factor GreB